jgi:iron complex outermembrane receptor protein
MPRTPERVPSPADRTTPPRDPPAWRACAHFAPGPDTHPMKLHSIPPACAVVAALACCTAAQAHDPADTPPARDLGTVVITGRQPTSLPTQLPTTVESITGRQIEDTINATDSEDALKYLPSLLVRKRYIGDYNHAVLSTRASGTGNSARSLVYADGILLSNLLGNGAAFAPRWGMVTPEEIERVDVLYGPFSAAYPGNSVGAVVDYVTRMPGRLEAHVKLGGSRQGFRLYGSNGHFGSWQTSASIGNREGAWSWRVNMNHQDSEGQPQVFVTAPTPPSGTSGAVPAFDRTGRRVWILGTSTQYRTKQDHLKAKLAYDPSPVVRASYTFGWWGNDAEGHGGTYLRDSATGQPRYTAAMAETRDRIEHATHAISVRQHTHGVFDWSVAASVYDYAKDLSRRSAGLLPEAAAGGPGTVTDQQGTGWRTLALAGVWRPPASRHVLDFGMQQDTYQLRTRVGNASHWIRDVDTAFASRFDGNTRLRSLYAQDAWRLAPLWNSVLGLRAEHWQAWGGLTQAAGQPATRTQAHPERDRTFWSPKAALAFRASDALVLKASAGRAIRFPTVSELYQGGFNSAGQLINNNPDLRPERSFTTELTAEWQWPRGQLRTTCFHERTKNGLFSQLNAATNANTVQNVGRLRTNGLEVALQAQDLLRKGVDLAGSLTHADSKVVENDGFPDTVGKQQIRVPKWRANLLATWRADAQWSATFGARYGGRQFNTLDNSDTNGFAYQGTSKFFTTDLRLRYRHDRHWSAALGVDNLNDYRYWNFHPYPQRTLVAELKFDL